MDVVLWDWRDLAASLFAALPDPKNEPSEPRTNMAIANATHVDRRGAPFGGPTVSRECRWVIRFAKGSARSFSTQETRDTWEKQSDTCEAGRSTTASCTAPLQFSDAGDVWRCHSVTLTPAFATD